MADKQSDHLVPDPQVAKEFGVSLMSLRRWTADTELKFPACVNIRGRNFRSRAALDAFRERMMKKALREARSRKKVA